MVGADGALCLFNPTPDRLNAVAGAVAVAGAPAVLDTTAQLLQTPWPDDAPPDCGVDATDPAEAEPIDLAATLTRRAKAKATTDAIVAGLLRLGTETPLRFAYARTAGCAAELTQDGKTITGRYCGNRWCGVCNRIRTAKLRTAYAPELVTWTDAYFVTLTVPNVKASKLGDTVRTLIKAVRRIANDVRRTDRLTWRAVRKVEVTYNPERRDYHPHLHLIVRGEAQARTLLKRWRDRFPEANGAAQDVRKADPEKSMLELFKYLTKQTIVVDGAVTAPPARALDVIYRAVRKLRTVQPMGFTVKGAPDEVTDDDATLELDASTPADGRHVVWTWAASLTDWVDMTTGECLTAWEPDAATRETIANITRDAFPAGERPPPDDG